MKEEEIIKQIRIELKSGEPFSFHRNNNKLIVGFRMNFDEELDEYEIYVCDNPKLKQDGVIRNKNYALK